MPKVDIIVTHSVEMDEYNKQDIKDIANQLASSAKLDIEDVVQSIETVSIKAEFVQQIDCMEKEGVTNG